MAFGLSRLLPGGETQIQRLLQDEQREARRGTVGEALRVASFGDSGTQGRLSLSDRFRGLEQLSLSSKGLPPWPSQS